MLTRIEIRGLRGITETVIEGLAPITMLVGANGSGKSTVLEAAGILCAGEAAQLAFDALAQREWLGIAGMKFWIPDQATIIGGWRDGAAPTQVLTRTLRRNLPVTVEWENLLRSRIRDGAFETVGFSTSSCVAVDEDGNVINAWEGARRAPFSLCTSFAERPAGARARYAGGRFSSRLRDSLAAIKLTPWYDQFVKYLRIVRPRLESIESLAVGDRDEPHVFEAEPRIGYPLAYAGDGFRRALLVCSALAEAKGGIAAIDEPEAFAHPRMFSGYAELFARAASDGTQVLLATHSIEFIRKTLELREALGECAVIGLDNAAGKIASTTYDGAEATRRVLEFNDDLRL